MSVGNFSKKNRTFQCLFTILCIIKGLQKKTTRFGPFGSFNYLQQLAKIGKGKFANRK